MGLPGTSEHFKLLRQAGFIARTRESQSRSCEPRLEPLQRASIWIEQYREQHILDAASELFVQYGYDKTTVADIAQAADVSKGTIYLHVESKQELFEKLIVREMLVHGPRWRQNLEDDPEGGTIAD